MDNEGQERAEQHPSDAGDEQPEPLVLEDDADGDGTGIGDIGGEEARGDGPHTALPPRVESWRRRSAAGAILTGFALGLQEALEKRKEEPSIVMETSGDPPKDLPVEADFEYGRPRHSTVQIRPWLLPGHEGGADRAPADDEPPEEEPESR